MGETRANVRARTVLRAFAAVSITVASFIALTVFGGLGGFMAAGPAAAQYEYGGKVTICHRLESGKKPVMTIAVSENAVDVHLAHGDTLGLCPG